MLLEGQAMLLAFAVPKGSGGTAVKFANDVTLPKVASIFV
jgi:hypothetical protein